MELKTYFAQDASGNIMPGATVTVYEAGTATLATGLQDESGSPLANPFTADSSAKVAFYAPDGLYDITVVGNGRTVTIRAQFVSVDGASVLRADLAATGGAALVGYDGGTAQDVLDDAKPMANYTALRAYTGRATGVRITQSGLAGFFQRDDADTTSADNGGTIIVDASGRRWKRLFVGAVNVKWFGAVGDGVTDDTAAILAAYTYCKSTTLHYGLRFPAGKYLTRSQFVFTDFYFGTMQMEGAAFIGASESASYDAVFKVVNAINAKITGAWTATASSIETGPANNPNLYENGAFFTAAPGGAIEPTKGIIAFVDVYGLKSTRVACGLKVGEKANDAQVAEITFHGYMSPYCPKAITVGGSQTVVNLNGCILSSNPAPFLTAPDYKTVKMDGGYINMVGGELAYHSDNTGPAVLMMPAESVLYGNPYPQIYLSGVLIETSAPFAKIENPDALSAPASYLSQISLVACGGYSGDLPSGSAFISVDDASYSGKITIDESCNFYRTLTAGTRAGATINCSTAPNAKVSVGRRAFDTATGYLPWMQGVSGGQLLHGQELAIMAYANASSYTSPGSKNVVFNTVENTGNYARYQSMLNTTTGVLTLSSTPPSALRVEASVLVGSVTGDIFIQDITNGRVVAFGQVVNGVANVCASVANPIAGQQFAVQVNLSGNVTFGGSITNNIAVYLQY